MFSNSNIELISYHGLVVERELWSGGSRVSFLCILLNDGVYTCNKHTVVTQEIREPPCYNVTFIQTLKSLCQYQENIKRVIKIFLFLSSHLQVTEYMAVLQTLCLRVKNSIIMHEPHILFSRFYISILPIIAPSTACHEEVSETHSYKKIE